nr:MAG: hypothetical protein DIU78_02895 [Pseudomonadota bacterium]
MNWPLPESAVASQFVSKSVMRSALTTTGVQAFEVPPPVPPPATFMSPALPAVTSPPVPPPPVPPIVESPP